MVEPPVNSCWDLPVLQQECRRTHLNADHLSFVEDGRLFFLHLTQYLGKGILAHLHSKSHAKCPELYKQESMQWRWGRMLSLSLVVCMTISGDISFSHYQKMLLWAARSEVDHILTRSTHTAVLNWPVSSKFHSCWLGRQTAGSQTLK